MILIPTPKYIDHVSKSRNYLNCPTFLFNEAINGFVRGYTIDVAKSNLRWWFTKWGYSLKDIDSIVEYHKNIHIQDFMKINVNSYIDNPPQYVLDISKRIDNWYKANAPIPTYWNPYPSQPSYPYLF